MDSPLLLGGPGVVVQIDESLFRHKPKVKLVVEMHLIIAVSSWAAITFRAMGFWDGGHISNTSTGGDGFSTA